MKESHVKNLEVAKEMKELRIQLADAKEDLANRGESSGPQVGISVAKVLEKAELVACQKQLFMIRTELLAKKLNA
jgi:hypothetical protein